MEGNAFSQASQASSSWVSLECAIILQYGEGYGELTRVVRYSCNIVAPHHIITCPLGAPDAVGRSWPVGGPIQGCARGEHKGKPTRTTYGKNPACKKAQLKRTNAASTHTAPQPHLYTAPQLIPKIRPSTTPGKWRGVATWHAIHPSCAPPSCGGTSEHTSAPSPLIPQQQTPLLHRPARLRALRGPQDACHTAATAGGHTARGLGYNLCLVLLRLGGWAQHQAVDLLQGWVLCTGLLFLSSVYRVFHQSVQSDGNGCALYLSRWWYRYFGMTFPQSLGAPWRTTASTTIMPPSSLTARPAVARRTPCWERAFINRCVGRPFSDMCNTPTANHGLSAVRCVSYTAARFKEIATRTLVPFRPRTHRQALSPACCTTYSNVSTQATSPALEGPQLLQTPACARLGPQSHIRSNSSSSRSRSNSSRSSRHPACPAHLPARPPAHQPRRPPVHPLAHRPGAAPAASQRP